MKVFNIVNLCIRLIYNYTKPGCTEKPFFIIFSILVSQDKSFDEAVAYYNKRSENVVGIVPDDKNILEAIDAFESLLDSEKDLEAAVYLVRSYYFMAQYVLQEKSDKMFAFIEGCLSFPNQSVRTTRAQHITVTADNYDKPITFGPESKDSETRQLQLLESV